MARTVGEDELIEHWTLVGEELTLLAGKRGPTKLAFALMLKFHQLHGRFPRGRVELPVEVVEFVAKAVKVPAAELRGYEWDGRTSKYHRTQIRRFTGFRECALADADKATDWLIEGVCQSERRPERVRGALLAYLREERIEPPAAIRLSRMVGSALERAEQGLKVIDRAILASSSSAPHRKGDAKAESEVGDEQVPDDSAAGRIRSDSARNWFDWRSDRPSMS